MYFHRITSPADEQQLLRQIIDTDTEIRSQKERKRIADISNRATYQKIFDPITSTMRSVAKTPPPVGDLITFEDNSPPPSPGKEEDGVEMESENSSQEESAYDRVLKSIRPTLLEDGFLGLCPDSMLIGKYRYSVDGDMLTIHDQTEGDKSFSIQDDDVWKLLLMKTPPAKIRTGEAAKKYREIIKSANLIGHFIPSKIRNRKKYDIGKGLYLYTKTPPQIPDLTSSDTKKASPAITEPTSSDVKNKSTAVTESISSNSKKVSTIVIPAKKQRLLRMFIQSLAELRAGNESMRNIVVQLAQAAKSRNILPKNLLTDDELTWAFA